MEKKFNEKTIFKTQTELKDVNTEMFNNSANYNKKKIPNPCVSYISIALKRQHYQDNLLKKAFTGAQSYRELEFMIIMAGSIAAGRQA